MRRRASPGLDGAMQPSHAHPATPLSRTSRNRSAPSLLSSSSSSLLLLLLLPCLALLCAPGGVLLRASGQNLDATISAPGGPSHALVLYGDVGVQRVPMRIFSITPDYLLLSSIVLSDPSSFAQLDPTNPALDQAFLSADLNVLVDASRAVAGNYTQQLTITARRSGVGATDEIKVLTLHITVQAALAFSTDATDSTTGEVSQAPSSLPEGSDFSQEFKLRSLPAGDVQVIVRANALHGDVDAVGPRGQMYRGGGPLVTLALLSFPSGPGSGTGTGTVGPSTNDSLVLEFTPTNWNEAQHVRVTAPRDWHMQGDRWTLLEYAVSAPSDPDTYGALLPGAAGADGGLPPARNLTILERDFVSIPVSAASPPSDSLLISPDVIDVTAVPGSTPPQLFSVALGSRPLADVVLHYPSAPGRYQLDPEILTFTPGDWSEPQWVSLSFFNSTSLIGRTIVLRNFTGAVSEDADYDGLQPRALRLQILDSNDQMASISPPFAFFTQSSASPTYLTLSFDPPRSFIPSAAGDKTLPSVACVFGNTDLCADRNKFYGSGNVGCENPYAQILVPGTIVSPGQMACPVPGCPSIRRSSASAGGVPSVSVQECDGGYAVVPLINGHAAKNSLPFVYLMPVTSAERQQPQILSISPDVVDVAEYTWITVRGSYFDTLTRYPNPTGADAGVAVGAQLAACKIAGIIAPAVDVSRRETDPVTGESKPIILCLSRPRPDLAGSTDKVPVVVEISLNGQEFTADGLTISLFDYDKQTTNTAWTYFFVAVALVGLLFAAMILQHFLCANFFRTHAEEEEATKIRVTRGPQMLIDLLEPAVAAQALAVREADKVEAAARSEAAQDDVKKRIAQIQREAAAKKEEKRRLKFERKAAKEAARIADAARQEVLAAAGLAPEIEMASARADGGDADEEREERRRRKREKREREAAAAAAAAALASSGGESGLESDGDLALASPSGPAFAAKDLADYDADASIAPLTAAALGMLPPDGDGDDAAHYTARSGYSSEGSRTSPKSKDKKKHKKHKDRREHSSHDAAATVGDEIEMGEMKQHYVYAQAQRPDADQLALNLGALASPSAPLDPYDHALSPSTGGGGMGMGMGVGVEPSEADESALETPHTEREKKRSKKKKDKEKDKEKDKSSKKKKHKEKEKESGGISGRQHHAMTAAPAAPPDLASARSHASDADSDAGDDAAAPASSRKKHKKDKKSSKKDKKSSKKKKKESD